MTFSSQSGVVLLQDGPYVARPIDQDTCDRLLGIFQDAGAVKLYFALADAAEQAGFIPSTTCLRSA